jgi:hypothetical protein
LPCASSSNANRFRNPKLKFMPEFT